MKKHNSIRTKLMALFVCTSVVALVINVMMYININQVLRQIDFVYEGNLRLNDMTQHLKAVQDNLYLYLREKSSSALENYFGSEQEFRSDMEHLETRLSDRQTDALQNNIYHISASYLNVTDEAVQAKRGRNVSLYNEKYQQAVELYHYLNAYITQLNKIQFQENSNNYKLLQGSLGYLEVVSTVVILVVIFCDIMMAMLLTRRITKPLETLAKISNQVSDGDMEAEVPVYRTRDEVEVLSKSLKKMMESIRDYIEKQRYSMEKENELRENELKSQTLLKEAELRYLQSQINPHFLFNTLNAGMQLATIEDAERTAVYIENMAEFFRYNLSKMNQDAELADEIRLVDHYIYILNVRFTGEIHFEKEMDDSLLGVRVPSMILQPLVENAVQYGIRDIDWQGKIRLIVKREAERVILVVEDNGKGMSEELIGQVLRGESQGKKTDRKSNGIGVYNVLERLRLYFGIQDVMEIESAGENKGTRFVLKIPVKGEGDKHV